MRLYGNTGKVVQFSHTAATERLNRSPDGRASQASEFHGWRNHLDLSVVVEDVPKVRSQGGCEGNDHGG